MTIRVAPWLVGLLAAGLSSAALGQSFTGFGPAPLLEIPGAKPGTPAKPPAPGPSAKPVVESGVAPSSGLGPIRNLESSPAGYRLAGEEAALTWPIYVTQAQAAVSRRLRVGYLSAISVAPESSSLTATVNNVAIGRTAIRAPGAVKIVEFDIPAGVLRPGFNAVRLAASQRHRVDCSLQATYELWTQIDPSRTGLVALVLGSGAQTLADLPAIPPDGQGGTPIRVVLGAKPSLTGLSRLIRVVQTISLAGRFSHPIVDFGTLMEERPGLNIVVGTAQELRAVPGLDPAGLAGSGPRTVFVPARENQAATLLVTGDTEADLDRAALGLNAGAKAIGSQPGLEAVNLTDGFDIIGGETLPVSKFGVKSQEFSGRLFRIAFDLALPSDFVPADYAKVMLNLAGGYMAGLASNAQIMVDINGRNAASVPLPREAGEVFSDQQVQLPLSRWRPGFNRVEIAAEVPRAIDTACTDSATSNARNRFLFLDSTSIQFPAFARALRLPDLAATTSGGGPYVAGKARPRLVLPVPDVNSVSAAVTLAARLAMSAGQVIDFEVSTNQQLAGRGATLLVSPAKALDPATLSGLGIDPEQLRSIWQARADTPTEPLPALVNSSLSLDALRRNIPAACALPSGGYRVAAIPDAARRTPASTAQPDTGGDRDLIARWSGELQPDTSMRDQVFGMVSAVDRTLRQTWVSLTAFVRDEVAPGPVTVPVRSSLVMGQALFGNGVDGLITVVTAPTAETLKASVACLVDPAVWTKIQGRFAFLDGSDGSVRTVDVDQSTLIATGRYSFENARLVGASWMSLNPWAYVLLTLGAALCLGLSTTLLVQNVGRTTR